MAKREGMPASGFMASASDLKISNVSLLGVLSTMKIGLASPTIGASPFFKIER
jgi:hypothetical protein